MHLIHLGRSEPALRSAWLAVCGANRAYDDWLTADHLERGTTPLAEDVLEVLVWTVAEVSGGRLGGPVER